MEISVGTLWVVYIIALIVLGIIFFFIAYRSSFRYSVGALLTTLIAGILVWALSVSQMELARLDPDCLSNLRVLYWVMAILFVLALIWVIVDIAMVGRRGRHGKVVEDVKVKCDDTGCEVDEVKRTHYGKEGMVKTKWENDMQGGLDLKEVKAMDKHHNKFKVKYVD